MENKKSDKNDINSFRFSHLALAEAVDAWRLIPRLLTAGYGFLLYKTISWYMNLEPHLPKGISPDGLTPEQIAVLLVDSPSTQHAALITAVVGVAAAIFGMYTSSGKKWNEKPAYWNDSPKINTPKPKKILEDIIEDDFPEN